MSRLYDHLAEIVETADGGFDLTPKSRQYFSRFLRQHGMTLRAIGTYEALIEALRVCNAADFAAQRQRRRITLLPDDGGPAGLAGNESLHLMVA